MGEREFDPVVGIFVLAAFLLVYFLPFIVAHFRGHKNTLAIFFLNLLAGWTFVGWVAAFVWSVAK